MLLLSEKPSAAIAATTARGSLMPACTIMSTSDERYTSGAWIVAALPPTTTGS
ncbi:MAG: hypothetical protein ACLQPV_01605 [Vulcanimicrobiaceae bacterium]